MTPLFAVEAMLTESLLVMCQAVQIIDPPRTSFLLTFFFGGWELDLSGVLESVLGSAVRATFEFSIASFLVARGATSKLEASKNFFLADIVYLVMLASTRQRDKNAELHNLISLLVNQSI
jgi:hypothetical protein